MRRSQITLEPIGRVRNEVKEVGRRGWREVVSELEIDSDLAPGLEGLEGFSHILVLFWMHKSLRGSNAPIMVHPQGRSELPLVGVFATRSPSRPNHLGMMVATLLGREGNVLKVAGLDAIDGTPILDIKPYLPRDSVATAIFPEWVAELDRRF
ncbi:tRNA (N6-threonylcarbamoyladenosine(37)-N6)-methyltransferase TrmO [Chloroflexota bacterium]